MTLKEYRIKLAWSVAELSRRTGLSPRTIARIENGDPVYLHSVAAVAKVLTEALGYAVSVWDIKGVNIVE
ncbi:MAG TPA: helix-turn-helix domain-containing protein [Ktedonobacteraceae bacterium]|nr:helix-turn-helix domain-containing protein [Ktedonobacteraceae bacterium]